MSSESLIDCTYGYIKTSTLCACQSLNIFQSLLSAGDGLSARELATSLDLSIGRLERLLDMATLIGLLSKNGCKYVVSVSCVPFLDENSECYQGAFIEHITNSSYQGFVDLAEKIKADYVQKEGVQANNDIFESLYSSDTVRESFIEAMWNLGINASQELVPKIDVSSYSSLVDVGGGNGSFAIPFANFHKDIKASIFDFMHVRESAELKISQFDLEDRVSFIEGDFWNDDFPEADIYVFGFILSDWTNEESISLLNKAKGFINKGGLIIILERLFNEDKSRGPIETSAQDLAMMIEANGQHRTKSEYESMLLSVGAESTFYIKSTHSKHLIAGVF